MLANAKKPNEADNFRLYDTIFLTVDGKEYSEEVVLNNNTYVSEKDHDKYGKVEVYTNGTKVHHSYFLKQFRGGRPGELLVDPYGMFAKGEDLSAYATQRGHRFCEYIRVSEEIYNTYVSYLQTRDSRYFRAAEKAVLDQVL